MAISETSHVERVLIVLNPDGSLKGAHAETLREWRDGASLIGGKQETTPLTADVLASILPNQSSLLVQVRDLEEVRDSLAADKADRDKQIETLNTTIASHDALMASLTAERDALQATVAERDAPTHQTVTPLQTRRALLAAGLLEPVEAFIASAPRDVQMAWAWSLSWERTSPLISQIGTQLGMTDQQIDALFAKASRL